MKKTKSKLSDLPPSELIALKEYYDKKSTAGMAVSSSCGPGCRTQESVDAEKISKKIENILIKITI